MLSGPQREALRVSEAEARMIERLQAWRGDMALHARECLRLVDKRSQLVPMQMNKAQMVLLARAEAQKARHGMVRAIVLKGRKQGASTLIGARFYTQAKLWRYRHAKVMAHDLPSTNMLFDMVKTFYVNDPARLRADTSNAKEFSFSNGSTYTVATAGGSGEAGRGGTPSLGHMSEVAFYKNAEKNFAGFANSIPTEPGTEIWVESTANGIGNAFHKRWTNAEAGLVYEDGGDTVSYVPIFTPWWLSDEYRLPVPSGFALSREAEGDQLPSEAEVAEMHGLSPEQMAWRRFQLRETFSGSVETFMQEYPCTPSEAFQTTGVDLFVSPVWLMRARKRTGIRPEGPRVLGVDPAGPGTGADKFSMTLRQGMVVTAQWGRKGVDPQEAIHWVADVMRTERVDRACIDNGGGWGASIVSGLRAHCPDLADKVFPVDFGGRSQFKQARPHAPGPRNRRAEMYMRARDWLMAPEGCSIPDDDLLSGDFGAVTQKTGGQSTDIVMEAKTDAKARLGRSPDDADSFVLTFAFPDSAIPSALTDTTPDGSTVFARGAGSAGVATDAPHRAPPAPPRAPFTTGRYDSGGGWMG